MDQSAVKKRPGYLLIALIFIGIALLFGCSGRKKSDEKKIKQETPTPSPSPTEKLGSVFFKGTTFSSRDKGFKNWEMTAREVVYDKDRKESEAREIEVRFFSPDKGEVLKLIARGATVDVDTKSLKFKGEVTAESPEGEKLLVKKLRWDNSNKLLIGEDSVKITRKDAILTAKRMEADPEMKKVKLSGNVKAFYPDAGKFLNF